MNDHLSPKPRKRIKPNAPPPSPAQDAVLTWLGHGREARSHKYENQGAWIVSSHKIIGFDTANNVPITENHRYLKDNIQQEELQVRVNKRVLIEANHALRLLRPGESDTELRETRQRHIFGRSLENMRSHLLSKGARATIIRTNEVPTTFMGALRDIEMNLFGKYDAHHTVIDGMNRDDALLRAVLKGVTDQFSSCEEVCTTSHIGAKSLWLVVPGFNGNDESAHTLGWPLSAGGCGKIETASVTSLVDGFSDIASLDASLDGDGDLPDIATLDGVSEAEDMILDGFPDITSSEAEDMILGDVLAGSDSDSVPDSLAQSVLRVGQYSPGMRSCTVGWATSGDFGLCAGGDAPFAGLDENMRFGAASDTQAKDTLLDIGSKADFAKHLNDLINQCPGTPIFTLVTIGIAGGCTWMGDNAWGYHQTSLVFNNKTKIICYQDPNVSSDRMLSPGGKEEFQYISDFIGDQLTEFLTEARWEDYSYVGYCVQGVCFEHAGSCKYADIIGILDPRARTDVLHYMQQLVWVLQRMVNHRWKLDGYDLLPFTREDMMRMTCPDITMLHHWHATARGMTCPLRPFMQAVRY